MKEMITKEQEPKMYKLIKPVGEIMKCDICNETIYDIKVTDTVDFFTKYKYFSVDVGERAYYLEGYDDPKHLHVCDKCIYNVLDKFYNREFLDESNRAFIEIEQCTTRAEAVLSRLKKPEDVKIILSE